ncbi:peptidylprolyl isomerase [Methanogenium sp. S4BF]|uniref:FKBP-type peptidyl-prolyl cis-trans isomerase n=1 Tax=Methanogenium sp. S4BF TaxID=1789226 RepID=UPI0024163B00|nr:peptidylprolyl isomerase [Methanogenium sp. S4BF]WFN35204.1 peptidylprolyl isomerase [Methanogenium sp. S4BF]
MKKRVLNRMTGLLCLLLICICAAGCTDQSQPTEVAAAGDTVQVDYKGYFDDGEVFDSSYERGMPSEFVVGAGRMIPGFDAAVVGMAVGETKTVRLSPDQAYGEWTEDKLMIINKNEFAENSTFEIGQSVYLSSPQGVFSFPIIAVNESAVTIDTNHHLVGKTLNFDIELVAINPADV